MGCAGEASRHLRDEDGNYSCRNSRLYKRVAMVCGMPEEKRAAPLEYDVLSVIWEKGEMTVAEVRSELARRGRILALTTVSTVLDRLYKKGLVGRKLQTARFSPRYVYFATVERSEYENSVVSATISSLLEKMTEPTISKLMELMAENEEDRELLSRYLEKLRQAQKERG